MTDKNYRRLLSAIATFVGCLFLGLAVRMHFDQKRADERLHARLVASVIHKQLASQPSA